MIVLRNSVWWTDYYDESGKRVRRSLRTTDKKKATMLALGLMEGKTPVIAGYGPTLEDAWKKAHKEYPGWRDAKSQSTLEGTWKQVSSHFGAIRLSAIDTRMTTAYSAAMLEAGLSGSTINQRLSFISVLFKQAITMWGYSGLTMPSMARAKAGEGRTRRISVAEELEILSWFNMGLRPRSKDMADLVAFLLDTGMRLSEALRVNDQTYSLEDGAIACWVNKGERPRAIPMTPRVKRILRRRQHMTTPFGMFTVDSAEHEWDWVRTKMGLEQDKEFVLHVLRHTVGSRLADAGIDGFVIQKLLGHRSITTTQKYIHVSTKGMEKAVEALSRTHIPRDHRRDQTHLLPGRRAPGKPYGVRRRRTGDGLLIRRS